jgi:hypothetical protein
MDESIAHMHVTLFGIEFTLPIEGNGDDSRQGQATYLVEATAAPEIGQAPPHPLPLTTLALESAPAPRAVPTFRCKAAAAAPLCDSARHERSGVQLI